MNISKIVNGVIENATTSKIAKEAKGLIPQSKAQIEPEKVLKFLDAQGLSAKQTVFKKAPESLTVLTDGKMKGYANFIDRKGNRQIVEDLFDESGRLIRRDLKIRKGSGGDVTMHMHSTPRGVQTWQNMGANHTYGVFNADGLTKVGQKETEKVYETLGGKRTKLKQRISQELTNNGIKTKVVRHGEGFSTTEIVRKLNDGSETKTFIKRDNKGKILDRILTVDGQSYSPTNSPTRPKVAIALTNDGREIEEIVK